MCSCVCALSWDFFRVFFFSLFHGQKSEQTSALLDSTAAATQARGIISPVLDQTGRSSSLHQDGPKNNLGGKQTLFCILTSFDRMAAALLIYPLTLASRCLSAVTRLGHFCRGVWLSALIHLSSPRLLTRLACIHQHPSTTRRSKKQVPVSSLQRFPPPAPPTLVGLAPPSQTGLGPQPRVAALPLLLLRSAGP